MLFAVTNIDKPGVTELRAATRTAHLDYFATIAAKLYQAGPTMGRDGKPNGSLVIVDAADFAEVEALMAADPYAKAGIFESTTISSYRIVFDKYAQVAG